MPTPMKSRITATSGSIVISTEKTKSWPLIFIFSLLILQNVYGAIRGLFFHKPILFEKIFLLVVCPTIILLALKGLLWQLKGIKTLEISPQKIIFTKSAPLKFRRKEYFVKNIKSINIKDETASIGRLAMLQLLGVTDRISIELIYGYDAIHTISGFGMTEAIELKQMIDEKLSQSNLYG